MGLFDFPRIHFSGNIDINVPTINNSFFFPLSMYDQTRSQGFIPPRLYFSSKEIIKTVTPAIPGLTLIYDDQNGYWYIEIEPINRIDLLRTWCMNPLGKVPTAPDAAYFPYYLEADNDLAKQQGFPIVGYCPGYWNMYGDMGVQMSEVAVTGVQTFDGTTIHTWTKDSPGIPSAIAPFLKAGFDFDSAPNNGHTTACMVETISSQSVYASIFSDKANLYDTSTEQPLFQGGPFRFGALLYGSWRVINWVPPMASSTRFCSAIALNELLPDEQGALVNFFQAQIKNCDNRTLKGIFITFTIFEVFENRYDQNYYTNNGKNPNPARATTAGSISPWYEGDLQTAVLGRNMISLGRETLPAPNEVPMNPAITSLRVLKNGTAIFSVDMGNSWPELMTPAFAPKATPPILPALRGDASFETATLGTLSFRYGPDASTQFAAININATDNPRQQVLQTGCIFDFVLTDATQIQDVTENFLSAFLVNAASEAHVLQESLYMICSDQKGLYADEGDLPSMGYQVNSHNREPCIIRILQKGIPVTTPVPLSIAQWIAPEAANDPGGTLENQKGYPDNIFLQTLADGDRVAFSNSSLGINNTAVYYFIYEGQYTDLKTLPFAPAGYTVMDTGSFVCMRVHPIVDYSRYIDPSNPNYTPPTFDVIYREIFKLFDIVYPIMGEIYPFTAEVWNNATVANAVLHYTDPLMWRSILYMPRSRELSTSQLQLLRAWANYIIAQNK